MTVLQISEGSFRPDAALVELGVDSLVAVEIRSWFLKEVSTDMAVLKILGGASTTDIAVFAVDQMPKKLLPGMGTDAPETMAKPETGESAAAKIPSEVKHPKNEAVSVLACYYSSFGLGHPSC
jgi:hybrid polyketide synthase/nonribosomal peptide synthetase ACE1